MDCEFDYAVHNIQQRVVTHTHARVPQNNICTRF